MEAGVNEFDLATPSKLSMI